MGSINLNKFLTAIDLLSKPAGITIDEMAEELNLSRRSVFRMLRLMDSKDMHFPITESEESSGRKKRLTLQKDYVKKLPNMNVPDIDLNLSEIIALYLLKGEAKIYKGTDIEKRVNSAFFKLGIFVPDKAAGKLERIKALFISASKFSKDYSGKEEIINTLTEAMLQQSTCLFKYHAFSDDRVKEYKIDPLNFFERNGGMYLFARVTRHGEIRIYAVERMKSIALTNDSFKYPEDFDPEEYLNSAFDMVTDDPIDVKIKFSADQARYVKERTWAKGQKITERQDGSIILEMKTSGMWDVKKWVLSFGADARVIKPANLKKEVSDELKAASSLYTLRG